jgi:MtN3 and saliva related transmembrane protein
LQPVASIKIRAARPTPLPQFAAKWFTKSIWEKPGGHILFHRGRTAGFTRIGKSGIARAARHAFWKVTALHPLFEVIGSIAAVITTFAWLPQIMKILRERQARDISLVTTASLASGVFLWVVYGLAIGSMPVILANSVSFLFIITIVGLKLRFD